MLLAIDIGNTNITAGVFQGESLIATWRLATDSRRMPDEYGLALVNLLSLRDIPMSQIEAVSLCSVVPPLTQVFDEVCHNFFSRAPLVVGAGVRTGIKVLYDNPRDVGADRIVDAAAAYQLYGGPVIIVDFGTATVFDAVSANAEYLGGAIAPGLTMGAESLAANTSILRRVELLAPGSPVGKNTPHAMQSGLVLGQVDMVEGMVRRFKKEIGANAKVVATGGLAPLIGSLTDIFDAVSLELTLVGLRIIYEMSQASGDRGETS